MAIERDLELLDDYLSNRLTGEERSAFEQKMDADPELKQEAKFQQDLVEGLRQARVAELKSMMNNIPVAPLQGNPTSFLLKAGSVVVITGIVVTGLYLYFSGNETTEPAKQETPATGIEKPKDQPVDSTPEKTEASPETSPAKDEPRKEEAKVADKKATEKVTSPATESKKPELKVYDPSKEEADDAVQKYEREQLEIISKAFVTSSIEVETDNTNKKLGFHYVFRDGKLVLYGAFERHLYEILEFISDDKRTVVLFHRSNYYLLDINKTVPTLMTPIRDKALLKKLQEYRGKQE